MNEVGNRLAEIERELQSTKSAGELKMIYFELGTIFSGHPYYAKQIMDLMEQGLKSEPNDASSLNMAYTVLVGILRGDVYADNEVEFTDDMVDAGQALELLKQGLTSDKNDADCLKRAYSAIEIIVNMQSELAGPVLELLKDNLKSDKNDTACLRKAYSAIGNIVVRHPEYAEQVLELFKDSLKSEQNDTDCLREAYFSFASIANGYPEGIKQVLDLFKDGLNSEQNNAALLSIVYSTLGNIVARHPEYAEQALELLAVGLKSGKNNYDSWGNACSALGIIVDGAPEHVGQVVELYKEISKSGMTNIIYKNLGEIACKHASYAPEILSMIQKDVRQKIERDGEYETRWGADQYLFNTLSDISRKHPDLMDQTLSITAEVVRPFLTSSEVLERAYSFLEKVIDSHPEKAETIFSIIENSMTSENHEGSTIDSVTLLADKIVKAKPELANMALSTILHGHEKVEEEGRGNLVDYPSLKIFFDSLQNIVRADTSLSAKVLQILIDEDEKDQVARAEARAHRRARRESIEDISEDKKSLVSAMAECLKNCRSNEVNIPERGRLTVCAAIKLKRSKPEERIYALNCMQIDEVAKAKFGTQQSLLNILVGAQAVENGKATTIDKTFREGTNKVLNDIYEREHNWMVRTSFRCAEIFEDKSKFNEFLEKATAHLDLHNAFQWFPDRMGEEKDHSFGKFLIETVLKEKEFPSIKTLAKIADNWPNLSKEEEQMPIIQIEAILSSKLYPGQKSEEFALEAKEHSMSLNDYNRYEQVYLSSLKVPEPFDSSKEFKFGQYTGKFLPRSDERVGFFGHYTDCCQRFGGVGYTCAVSSMIDPYSQLFVIEDSLGKIVAGSWVWENNEGKYRTACFDNVEAFGACNNNGNEPCKIPDRIAQRIYEEAAKYMCEEKECRQVTIGKGNSDIQLSNYEDVTPIALPKHSGRLYTDATQQVLLRENPEAKPLDKTAESLRFIRDVCFRDEGEMRVVSERCFPEGDRALQKPDNLSGKVLVDKDKGVVGYCLYDAEEKHIYDMAVLPEYRKDKNASSSKLFLEISKDITKQGGEWSLEARDKTTYRYLQIMEARGMIKMNVGDVDHEMSDGSKVYNVSFKVVERAQNTNQKEAPMVSKSKGEERS